MKYTLKLTAKYKKNYRLMQKRGMDMRLLDTVVEKLLNGETLDPRYRDHALTGNFKGFRECHIRPDWLLVYLKEDDILVLTLTNTGTHAGIFKM